MRRSTKAASSPARSETGRRSPGAHITPTPDSENLAQRVPPGVENKIGLAVASGAYFVETNGGGAAAQGGGDPTVTAYRANAAAAQHSRVVAEEVYGPHRPYGYAYGGSGGGYRTIGGIENTEGVWDGVVPYVIGSPVAIPSVFSVRMHAMRVLEGKFPQIVDALEPGGSGDPYEGLDAEERAALREVTRMGFPPESWFGHETMGVHGFAAVYPAVVAMDPAYFTDFWTEPGYLGADPASSVRRARVQHPTTVAGAITAAEAERMGLDVGEATGGVDDAFYAQQGAGGTVAFRLASAPGAPAFLGGDLVVRSGTASGQRVPIGPLDGDVAVLGAAAPGVVEQVAPGDTVVVDNSHFLAAQTYHRHQVPGPEFDAWDQFRGPDGEPVYPQRPALLGPIFTRATAGSLPTGRFDGKMIVVAALWDREAFPWQAAWYRDRVEDHLGDRADEHFRLWYVDRALHGDDVEQEDPTRTVSYVGVLHWALRDLSAWVERGVEPPASTDYRVVDAQVVVPPRRRGAGGSSRSSRSRRTEASVRRSRRARRSPSRPSPGCRPAAAGWSRPSGTWRARAPSPSNRRSRTPRPAA